jgi:hypothetical protein
MIKYKLEKTFDLGGKYEIERGHKTIYC